MTKMIKNLKNGNQKRLEEGILKFCRDPDNDVFLCSEIIESIDFDELKIKDFEDFPMVTNQILTDLNHPTYFNNNTNM